MDRFKACLNPECDMYTEGKKFEFRYKFCPLCKSDLKHVCANKKCFNIVENPVEELCSECLEKAAQKEQERKELKDKIVNKTIDNAAAVGAGIAAIAPFAKKNLKKTTDFVKKLKK